MPKRVDAERRREQIAAIKDGRGQTPPLTSKKIAEANKGLFRNANEVDQIAQITAGTPDDVRIRRTGPHRRPGDIY